VADAPIQAQSMTVGQLFGNRKFGITYYQREYSWSRENVKALLGDLERRFRSDWTSLHERPRVQSYAPYFLGSIVYYEDEGITYVVDGQQRITTLHLLLIYLRRLLLEQDNPDDAGHLESLIVHLRRGRTFTVGVDEHQYILRGLMDGEDVDLRRGATPSERHLRERARDLQEDFPAALRGEALEMFVDWLLDRVCLTGVRASGREHGWEIFETTNNRGKQLGPIDLMKGYILTKAETGRPQLNKTWREMVAHLYEHDQAVPSEFVKDYLLARYVDVKDEDERRFVQEAFHEWVRENTEKVGLTRSQSYAGLVHDMAVAGRRYAGLVQSSRQYQPDDGIHFFNEVNGIPHHRAAVLAGGSFAGTDGEFRKAAKLVANFLDLIFVRNVVVNQLYDVNRLEDAVLETISATRGCRSLDDLTTALTRELRRSPADIGRMATFVLTINNKPQVRYLLARLTDFAETAIGRASLFDEYISRDYQIEHIWANNYEQCRRDTGISKKDFDALRNRLGALLLLPQSDNASYRDLPYATKLETYQRHNILAASLHPNSRKNAPKYNRFLRETGLGDAFRHFPDTFDAEAVRLRQWLYQRLCELIWDPVALGFPDAADEAAPAAKAPLRGDPVSSANGRSSPSNGASIHAAGEEPLLRLLESGHLRGGEILIGVSLRPKLRAEAELLPTGRIKAAAGAEFPSLDEAAAFAVGRSRKGWDFWHVERGDNLLSLKMLRQTARVSTKPGERLF
jgi:hypothetical protein